MMIVAVLGLVVNIIAAAILQGGHRHNLNLRGAFLHVVSDAVGSVGAIVAGVVMWTTGWYLADPIISVLISVLILFSSWSLVKDSLSVLMQAVPKGIRLEEVRQTIEAVEGVSAVHDLHIWAVTSDIFTLSAHAVVANGGDFHEVLNGIEDTLRERFNIEHTTIQLETESREEKEFKAF
jgi:cobalt-zinc-cadmium efflux system protein